MIQTFLLFQDFLTSFQPSDLLDFYHYNTLLKQSPRKLLYAPDLVLEKYVILVECFLHFKKPDRR